MEELVRIVTSTTARYRSTAVSRINVVLFIEEEPNTAACSRSDPSETPTARYPSLLRALRTACMPPKSNSTLSAAPPIRPRPRLRENARPRSSRRRTGAPGSSSVMFSSRAMAAVAVKSPMNELNRPAPSAILLDTSPLLIHQRSRLRTEVSLSISPISFRVRVLTVAGGSPPSISCVWRLAT